jgi:hypothetical protein
MKTFEESNAQILKTMSAEHHKDVSTLARKVDVKLTEIKAENNTVKELLTDKADQMSGTINETTKTIVENVASFEHLFKKKPQLFSTLKEKLETTPLKVDSRFKILAKIPPDALAEIITKNLSSLLLEGFLTNHTLNTTFKLNATSQSVGLSVTLYFIQQRILQLEKIPRTKKEVLSYFNKLFKQLSFF